MRYYFEQEKELEIFSLSENISAIANPNQQNSSHEKEDDSNSSFFVVKQNSSKNKLLKTMSNNNSYQLHHEDSNDLKRSNTMNQKHRCKAHRKELELICINSECGIAICANCVLFGDHNGHNYLQKDQFEQLIKEKKFQLQNLEKEIIIQENKFVSNNLQENLKNKIEKKKQSVLDEINLNCDKTIQIIQNRRKDLHRQCEFHFNQLFDKFIFLTSETKSSLKLNDNWKHMIQSGCESDSLKDQFDFLNKIDQFDLITSGKNILEAVEEIRSIINERIEEGLNTFKLIANQFDEFFLDTQQFNFDYDYDLKETLKEIIQSKNNKNDSISILTSKSLQEDLFENSTSENYTNTNLQSKDDCLNENSYVSREDDIEYIKRTSMEEYIDTDIHTYCQYEDSSYNEQFHKTNENYNLTIDKFKFSDSNKKLFVDKINSKIKNNFRSYNNPSDKNTMSNILKDKITDSKLRKKKTGQHSYFKGNISSDSYGNSQQNVQSFREMQNSFKSGSNRNLQNISSSRKLNNFSHFYEKQTSLNDKNVNSVKKSQMNPNSII